MIFFFSPLPPSFLLFTQLPPLSTYLVATEQCRRRRALKDRLHCLGILVSLFLFHILGLMRHCVAYSRPYNDGHPASSRKIVCFLPLGRNKRPVRFPLFRFVRGKLKSVELPFSTDCSFSAFAERQCCICGGSASSVWTAVITLPHCLCGSQ